MKWNILYVFWVVLFIIAVFLVNNFVRSSQLTVFGIADTEGVSLNFEYPVVVKNVFVRAGSKVQKGDTLMVLQRPELEREATQKSYDVQINSAEKQARVKDTDKEIERLRSDFTIKTNEMRTQIQLLESEEKTQADLRKVVDKTKTGNNNSIIVEKINALKNALRIEEQRFAVQLKELNRAKAATSSVFDSKKSSVNQEINFLEQAKGKLILLSPINGFVENIFASENQITPQYNPLLKLNPQRPNKIKGFLPESVDMTYRFGDTVQVYSARRPSVKAKAVLIGSNPQLVELPMRLRKYQTASTWGRELYISLPIENDFFIGEKIIIKMNSVE